MSDAPLSPAIPDPAPEAPLDEPGGEPSDASVSNPDPSTLNLPVGEPGAEQ